MGFRAEVRSFMKKMELEFVRNKTIIGEQSRMILMLKEQNKDLLNRLMARDFRELQIYDTSDTGMGRSGEELGPEYDEDSAGEVLEILESKKEE